MILFSKYLVIMVIAYQIKLKYLFMVIASKLYDVYVLIIYCIGVLVSLDDSSFICFYDCRLFRKINQAFRYRK